MQNTMTMVDTRRGSSGRKRRPPAEEILVQRFFIVALSILFVGYYIHYSRSQDDRLAEEFSRGHIHVMGLTGHIRHNPNDSPSNYNSKATIGYAITVTHCPAGNEKIGPEIADAAAVLRHSIHVNSIRNAESGSKYDYQMYAIVHHDAVECAGPTLKSIGYKVLSRSSPVELKYIHGEYLRERLPNDGCCGVNEFTKLHAYTLVDHPAVVLMDLDSLVMKPMDNLFDVMIGGAPLIGNGNIEVAFGDPIQSPHYDRSKGINAFFTREYNIADDTMEHVAVQGGFLVIKPSLMQYADFSSVIRVGEYQQEGGWAGLGFGPFEGSTAFQELFSYFYDHIHPGAGVELNRCVYNNMVDDPRDSNGGSCKDGYNRSDRKECEDCRSRNINEVSDTNESHFTKTH